MEFVIPFWCDVLVTCCDLCSCDSTILCFESCNLCYKCVVICVINLVTLQSCAVNLKENEMMTK
jgi:hypothetical protein